ncbi:SCRT [Lepeophtheirus salmonis]|uniref:SCRT n=1 Tax=Lepeophtheirus salmonis TaxID=72036 RepID=A0A7R8CXF2_LEPSM|nr:SCRT [Lepeophtheirus salmonis]CAF2959121.1 SCRT [Lepeophtheirus salmonis]
MISFNHLSSTLLFLTTGGSPSSFFFQAHIMILCADITTGSSKSSYRFPPILFFFLSPLREISPLVDEPVWSLNVEELSRDLLHPIIDVVKTESTEDEDMLDQGFEVSNKAERNECPRQSHHSPLDSNLHPHLHPYSEIRGSTLITPPPEVHSVKKDLFRPYCLQDPILAKYERPVYDTFFPYTSTTSVPSSLQYRNIEDINTAHAILDLSSSARTTPSSSPPEPIISTPTPLLSPASSAGDVVKTEYTEAGPVFKVNNGKTTAYTYEAFFASDGRSRKKSNVCVQTKPRYSCSECGKHYATSSNLSRHKQTHRSLDSNNAKKCHVCVINVMYAVKLFHVHGFSRVICDLILETNPMVCAHCGKSFADRSNLRAHMQTHSAYKNFKCKRCNKSFALKSYLNKHYESACFKDAPSDGSDSNNNHDNDSSDPESPLPSFPPPYNNDSNNSNSSEDRPILTVLSPATSYHHSPPTPIVNPQHHLLRV